jgi:hypothetical protein
MLDREENHGSTKSREPSSNYFATVVLILSKFTSELAICILQNLNQLPGGPIGAIDSSSIIGVGGLQEVDKVPRDRVVIRMEPIGLR